MRRRALILLIAGMLGGHIGASVGGMLLNISIGGALTVFAFVLFPDTTGGREP